MAKKNPESTTGDQPVDGGETAAVTVTTQDQPSTAATPEPVKEAVTKQDKADAAALELSGRSDPATRMELAKEAAEASAAAAVVDEPLERTTGPTIEEYVGAGYKPENYPPPTFAEVPSPGLERFKRTGSVNEPAVPMAWDQTPDAGLSSTSVEALVPMNNGQTASTAKARDLLLDACDKFGINPTRNARPKELASWNYYPGNTLDDVPAAVVLVTQGGVKLKHFEDPDYPMDQDTEETLRRVFSAFRIDPKTKEVIPTDFPNDLALPIVAVTGIATSQAHRYRRGYLREGGKTEANRREANEKSKRTKR